MAKPEDAIPSTGAIKARWIQNGKRNLCLGAKASLFRFKDDRTDELVDAVVVEKDGEFIASGWITNLLEWDSGGEAEKYWIQHGKEEIVAGILEQYSLGSEKVGEALAEARMYGLKLLFVIDFFGTLIAGLIVFAMLTSNLFKDDMPIACTIVAGIAILPSIFAVYKRNKMVKEKRKELLLDIVDEVLLCRLYMAARENRECGSRASVSAV